MLLRHFEQRLVRQPLFQRTNRCRVAAKGFVAEGIHQIKINFLHCLFLSCYGFLAQKNCAFQIERRLPLISTRAPSAHSAHRRRGLKPDGQHRGFPQFSLQYGISMVCAEPVTGSSGRQRPVRKSG
jgi:hypothetical protein